MTESKSSPGVLDLRELAQLQKSPMNALWGVDLESVGSMLEGCPLLELEPDEAVIVQGESNRTMYLVLAGRLSVCLDDLQSKPVAFLEEGQVVGELSVIDASPASAHVKAADGCRLMAIDEESFWRLVEVSHAFATNMLLSLAARLRANNSLIVEGVNQRILLERQATVDGLTGLRNRRWLDDNLDRLVNRHHISRRPFCVLMLDVDHFKKFNDTYGHAAGDQVLRAVAKVVAGRLRPTDLTARFGGEEFVAMLPETDLDGARVAAERLRKSVEETRVNGPDGKPLPKVTISLGLAQREGEESGTEVLARADTALYDAKKAGRNRVSG